MFCSGVATMTDRSAIIKREMEESYIGYKRGQQPSHQRLHVRSFITNSKRYPGLAPVGEQTDHVENELQSYLPVQRGAGRWHQAVHRGLLHHVGHEGSGPGVDRLLPRRRHGRDGQGRGQGEGRYVSNLSLPLSLATFRSRGNAHAEQRMQRSRRCARASGRAA